MNYMILYYLEVVSLSIMELWKHKQNDVFQSYGNDRIKGIDTEDFCKVESLGMVIRP